MVITVGQAKKLRYNQEIYRKGAYNADGTAQRWRVAGKPKTWKTQPSRVEVPIKHGLNTWGRLTSANLKNFTTKEPKPKPRKRKR